MSTTVLLLALACSPSDPFELAPDDGFLAVAEVAGGLKAAGPGWMAEFEAGRMRFTPALGRGAERNRSLGFVLEGVGRAGGDALAFAPEAAPQLDAGGDLVRFERADGLVEQYALAPAGVEQSFLLHDRPAGHGDLVVRGRLEASVPWPAVEAVDGGWAFHDPELGGVHVGAVTGVDADGRRQAGQLELEGDELRLVLPASFVDEARFPLLVDPIWSTTYGLGNTGGASLRDPDLTYDPVNDQYGLVVEAEFSLSDSDVYFQRRATDGTLIESVIVDPGGDGVHHDPRVEFIADEERFVVAFLRQETVLGAPEIRTQVLGTSSELHGVLVAFQAFGDARSIDLAKAVGPSGQDAVVLAYGLADGDCNAITLGIDSAGDDVLLLALTSLYDAPDTDAFVTRPFLVDWEAGGRDVLIERSKADRTELWIVDETYDFEPSLVRLEFSTYGASLQPSLVRLEDWFLLAFRDHHSSGDGDILLEAIKGTPAGFPADIVADASHSTAGKDERWPVLVDLGDEIALIFARQEVGGPTSGNDDYELVYTPFLQGPPQAFPFPLSEPVQTDPAGPWVGDLAVAGQGSAGDGALLTFQTAGQFFSSDKKVYVAAFEAQGSGGPVTDLGGGCGGGGVLSVDGDVAIGNPSFRFELDDLDPVSILTVFNINLPGSEFNCGGCTVMEYLVPYVAPAIGGQASLQVPIVHAPSIVGKTIALQASSFYSQTPNCSLLPNVSWSNILHLTFGT